MDSEEVESGCCWSWQCFCSILWQKIIDYYYYYYLNFLVLSDKYFVHSYSLSNTKLHDDKHICVYLAKMWVTWKGFNKGSITWENFYNTKIWKIYVMPQQLSNWECNYYILKCITNIFTRKKTTPLDLWELSDLKSINIFTLVSYSFISYVSLR